MAGKITAHFGADVSEVEAGMLRAQRATKRYEQAVKSLDGKASGGFAAMNSGAGKVVGRVKELAGAFGQAGMAAGLVPGIGIAAIGVAAVIKGVSMIREHYAQIAADAKAAMEYMQRSAERFQKNRESNMSDPAKLEAARIDLEQKRGMLIQFHGKTDLQILADREAFEIALFKYQELQSAAKKKAASDEEKARQAHSKKVDDDAKRELENYARSSAKQKQLIEDAKKAVEDRKVIEFSELSIAEKIKKLEVDKTKASTLTNDEKIRVSKIDTEIANKKKEADAQASARNADALKNIKLSGREAALANEKAYLQSKKLSDEISKLETERANVIKESRSNSLEIYAIETKIFELKSKQVEDQKTKQEDIDKAKYDRAWRFATMDQRIAQVRKEGREAQAAYDKNASSENLLALEKARKKWIDLRDEINGAKKDAGGAGGETDASGRTRGADGKLRKNGAVVSAEDAARTDATRARDASLMRDTMNGRISDAGKVGGSSAANQTDKLLQEIRDSLKATYVGKQQRA